MTDKFDIDSLVTEAFKLGGSDIHLLPASPVYYRNNTGDIAILSRQYINANEIKAYFLSIATDEQRALAGFLFRHHFLLPEQCFQHYNCD